MVVSLSDETGKTADHSDPLSWRLKKTACISGRRRMGSVSVSYHSDFSALLAHLSSPETSDGEQRCMVLKSMAQCLGDAPFDLSACYESSNA